MDKGLEDISPKKIHNWPISHEKKLNVTDQENANQSHNEIPLPTY